MAACTDTVYLSTPVPKELLQVQLFERSFLDVTEPNASTIIKGAEQ
jgi:hypothetical protein